MKAEFVKVARLDDLHEQRGKLVMVDGEDIALFKRNGAVYALHNVCSHQHFSKLHDGIVEGSHVTCPMHGWTYDMTTGKATNGSGKVRRFNVMIKDNDVYVQRPDR